MVLVLTGAPALAQEPVGSIRGTVYDQDFDVPLAGAQVQVAETGQTVFTAEQGNYVFPQVRPGTYTVVFSKEGYAREVRTGVAVQAGLLTEANAWLTGDFTEMEEFVVEDILQIGGAGESELLALRFESPALMDSISADLMSRAGASDAASAVRLVVGATVQDGKYAVIRGLPDRYVSSQLNGTRLPSADEDKRAVELDQFPAAVIESIQVSKTFTPDQQGDASGGAVDVRLKGIPDETILQFKSQLSYNSQVTGRNDFLTYEGGGLSYWGDDGGNDIQFDKIGQPENWDGAVGVSRDDAPIDYKWSFDAGGSRELTDGIRIGGLASFFYERDSSFTDDKTDESYWAESPGGPLVPQKGGADTGDEYTTALYDITEAQQSVQWGGLTSVGLETERHALSLAFLYSHTAEDTATLAEDTKGKSYFFPGYDPSDITTPGHAEGDYFEAPYLRLETLEYTERTTGSLQLHGEHTLPSGEIRVSEGLSFSDPVLDWTLASSFADLVQPDKRMFGSFWVPFTSFGPLVVVDQHYPLFPDTEGELGNLQRIWKTIEEDSEQLAANLKMPFTQWQGEEGYLKTGLFNDAVHRRYDQDSFSNTNDFTTFTGGFDEFWSASFPFEDPPHPISASDSDVDYDGDFDVSAWYGMIDLPLSSKLDLIGGARWESTDIDVVNHPEADAKWLPPGSPSLVDLNPGDADVDFEQSDVLPSVGLAYTPMEGLTVRASYGATVARQTFKELTPILQQEYLGGPIFVGNPELVMSSLDNYDLRVDYRTSGGSLYSASVFHKDIEDPIEYEQELATSFSYTTAVNYPEGKMSGVELELRRELGSFWDEVDGLALGANATFIESEVTLPDDEAALFEAFLGQPYETRDMTNAPEYVYNVYLTYDLPEEALQFALFYTVQGDTLVAGAGLDDGNFAFVPSVYAKAYGTLNFSVSKKFDGGVALQFQAKNLTNPSIEEFYDGEFVQDEVTKTSYTKGVELSIGLSLAM